MIYPDVPKTVTTYVEPKPIKLTQLSLTVITSDLLALPSSQIPKLFSFSFLSSFFAYSPTPAPASVILETETKTMCTLSKHWTTKPSGSLSFSQPPLLPLVSKPPSSLIWAFSGVSSLLWPVLSTAYGMILLNYVRSCYLST